MIKHLKSLWQRRWVKYLLEISFFVLLYLAVKTYTQRHLIEGIAPPIIAPSLQGELIDLHQQSSRPVLLHFWASWCGVCRFEQDTIQELSKEYRVISIAMQSGDDLEVIEYLNENSLDFIVLNDPDGLIAKQYGVTGLPTSFVINEQNEIAYSESGFTSEWGLRFRMWLAD